MPDTDSLSRTVDDLMPQLTDELARLVAIRSVSELGYPEHTRPALLEAHDAVAGLFREVGVETSTLELPDTAPIVIGEIPAPPGAPTVLLYSHYDVVGPGDESAWKTPPFEATERDGAIYGRGSADTKSNILMHVGALRAWDGRPPVGIKIVIEGQEETGSAFTTYPPSNPDLFAADAMVIGDMGSLRPGVPTLTIALRGMALPTVEVTTMAGPKHSGQFGGAAPDALIVLLHALASLHDANGDVSVPGLRREKWAGATYSDDEFRSLAEIKGDAAVPRHRWSRRTALVRPGDHRHRYRRSLGGQRAQRGRAARQGQAQPARPPRPGSGRGAGDADPVPRGAPTVRDPARRRARADRAGVHGEDGRAGLRRRADGARHGVGRPRS